MKKKNILTAAVSLSLVACLSIGATLAYFTDKTDAKTNVFTTGHVDISLSDFGAKAEGDAPDLVYGERNNQGGYTYNDFVPGDTLKKQVGVVGMPDTQDAWVAVRVKATGMEKTDLMYRLMDAIAAAGQTNNWEMYPSGNDFVLVAKNAITAGERKTLFDSITIPTDWDNSKTDYNFTISVEAYAAQKDNLDYNTFVEMARAGADSFEEYVG